MQIEEVLDEEESFSFHPLPVAQFKTLENKTFTESLLKWGLFPQLAMFKFRFDQNFSKFQVDSFMQDFFNDPEVRAAISNSLSLGRVNKVKYSELSSSALSLDLFDRIESSGITSSTGYIKKCYEEIYEGITVSDKLREMLLIPESENADLYSAEEKKELLFHIFKRIALGGPISQYEDIINDYFEVTKCLYKDLVSVSKDSNSGQLKVTTHAYEIEDIEADGGKLFVTDSPNNFAYVTVDPFRRHVTFLYFKWTSFW